MTAYETIFTAILVFITGWYAVSMLVMLTGLLRVPRTTSSEIRVLTVVVAACNEEQHIERCLQSLAAQDYPHDSFEVIIADDRSTDRTPQIVHDFCIRYQNFSSVRVEPDERDVIPKKTALFRAIDKARGEIIVSTDADCVQPEGWLSSMNACFDDSVGMVVGHTRYHRPQSIWAGIDAIDYLSHRALGVAFIGIGSAYTCTASNFAYRKEIFDSVREELEQLKVRPAEDNFLLHYVHKKSPYRFAVATHPDSIVTTGGAAGLGDFLQQRFRWGAYGGNILTPGIMLFFIPALLYYCLFWVGLFSSFFSTSIFTSLLISLGIKLCVDILFMIKAASLHGCRYLIAYFLPGFLYNLILTIPIMIKGNLFTFEWKDRRYTAARAVVPEDSHDREKE